jgi:hypothetical protein
MIRAGTKQKFASQLTLKKFETRWFDLTGLARIDDKRIAKLEIHDRGHSDHYGAIDVTILNRVTGTLDVKTFRFDDYLSFDMKDRSDTRTDYNGGFYADRGLDWYIARPKSVEPPHQGDRGLHRGVEVGPYEP